MLLLPVAILALLTDQITKQLALLLLSNRESVPVLGNFFSLTLVQNEGIAFGLLGGLRPFLVPAIALSIVALSLYLITHRPARFLEQIAFGLILGGAVGNLMDRLRYGFVIDFFDFHVWPVFNVADSSITVGIAYFILVQLFGGKRRVS